MTEATSQATDLCGCCEGIGIETPEPLYNPPGQPSLSYRVGTYHSFFRTMLAQLGRRKAEAGVAGAGAGANGCLGEAHRTFLLGGEPDAGTALLDGWACVADVLTFYQERIANEGYLRTAVEQRSVVELGRLTGYEPRPGVAASVHLAFAVQDGFDGSIPAGTRAQSMPRPDQTAQVFETSEALAARAEWNAMPARRRATGRYVRREYLATADGEIVPTGRIELFLAGTDQNVQVGDVIALAPGADPNAPPAPEAVYRVTDAWPSAELEHTTVRLVPLDGAWRRGGEWDVAPALDPLDPLAATPGRATATPGRATRTLEALIGGLRGSKPEEAWSASPDAVLALAAAGAPEFERHLRAVLRTLLPEPAPQAHVMRLHGQAFGHNAPEIITTTNTITETGTVTTQSRSEHPSAEDEFPDVLYLDGEHAAIRAGSWLVMRAPPAADPTGDLVTIVPVTDAVEVQSRTAYAMSGRTTRITLSVDWWAPETSGEFPTRTPITPLRRAVVYAQPEPLALLGEPIEDDVAGSVIDLDAAVEELPADRLLIVEGERADLPGTTGLHAVELVRVAGASTSRSTPPRRDAPEERRTRARAYTRVTLTAPLAYRYKRSTVVVHGNVAHATHGETRDEVLGSGDASIPSQRFTLRQGPRTWVSAPTPSGIASTLEVRVSGVLWPEVPWSSILGPTDEVVRTRAGADGGDEIAGGDGRHGARFPTGVENLTARYRVGIGAAGNVEAGLVTALLTRPMGVREVVNPIRASGGADPDGRDEIRLRIPIAARGVDRLVSVADHADFALGFAGVDKAAAQLRAGEPEGPTAGLATVEVVIAGAEDVPIEDDSDLLSNLRAAFRIHGDPMLRTVVRVARAVPLVLEAHVRIDPRYEWAHVEAALRERLLERSGWDARGIGEAVHLSSVLEALQSVPGVRAIDVDVFGPLRRDQPPPVPPPPPPPSGSVAARFAERVAGLIERLDERDRGRRWSFAAEPDQILYFARALPGAVAFLEVAP
jgi:predicted phage baseplate assembly protein